MDDQTEVDSSNRTKELYRFVEIPVYSNKYFLALMQNDPLSNMFHLEVLKHFI